MLILVSRENDGRETLQDCNGCFSLPLFFFDFTKRSGKVKAMLMLSREKR